MIYDVISAEYAGGYTIRVTFENGKTGLVDFQPFIARGGVFGRLKDAAFFRRFQVDPEFGVLTWGENQEIDIAPETLYHLATGEPLPAWMEADAESRKSA